MRIALSAEPMLYPAKRDALSPKVMLQHRKRS